MQDRQSKKAAIEAFKEKKVETGVVLIVHGPTGTRFIGVARNLESYERQMRFALNTGGYPMRAFQALWSEAKGDGFVFEIQDRLGPDVPPYLINSALSDLQKRWVAALGATKL